MVMFSNFRSFAVHDGQGGRAQLLDLSIDLESDYPPITRLLLRSAAREQLILPWEAVKTIDWRGHQIMVSNLAGGASARDELVATEVLLGRDVIDALVLDLQNRRATRANDLWLKEKHGRLLLNAVDTSAHAVLRRLSLGRFGGRRSKSLYDWKYVEFLRGDPLAVRKGAGYRMRSNRLPAGEIASLSNALPYLHAAELLTLLPDELAADTLELMSLDRQLQVFGVLDEEQALRLLALMAPNAATDLFGRLGEVETRYYLERLPEERADRVVELLRYPKDTVGGIMTNDVVSIPTSFTVEQARIALRDRLKMPDFAHFIYVVADDQTRTLRGAASLRDIVMIKENKRMEEIMNPYVITLHPLQPASDGAYRVLDSHLAALPVVGKEVQLIGIVTVDAAVAQVAPQNWSTQAPKIFS
jgi:CBS domain-containing protein